MARTSPWALGDDVEDDSSPTHNFFQFIFLMNEIYEVIIEIPYNHTSYIKKR
jgi:hypothetical protein